MAALTQEPALLPEPKSLYDLPYEALEAWLRERGEPAYRARQIFHGLYVRRAPSIEALTDLPKALRAALKEAFVLDRPTEVARDVAPDGTIKLLLALEDGEMIETVIMRHRYGPSVCVTTQVGCRIGCTFCASTLGGLKRNLRPGEIVAQVLAAQRLLDAEGVRLGRIVVMGIGEPFENYDATVAFLRIVTDPRGLGIGQRHITVSTSGIVPRIYDFAELGLQVRLALSLHAPTDELRTRLMPINKKYPLADVMTAAKAYVEKTRRRITFEYILLGGVNDRPEHARALAELVRPVFSLVNLIPYNPVPERPYVRAPEPDIRRFRAILEDAGIVVTRRREHGTTIAAACGQLRARHAVPLTVRLGAAGVPSER